MLLISNGWHDFTVTLVIAIIMAWLAPKLTRMMNDEQVVDSEALQQAS